MRTPSIGVANWPFLTEFPTTISGRLEWYSKELGLNPYRLLRLAGVAAAAARTASDSDFIDWGTVVQPCQETARNTSHLLGRLFWYFDYDQGNSRSG